MKILEAIGRILSINISEKKGIEKDSVEMVNVIEGWGVENDAHGGEWDRQVSIFSIEAMKKVPPEKMEIVKSTGYTENFTISGVPLEKLGVGAVVRLGEAEVEICHIGKEIFKEEGRPYIVSREGRFGKVVKGGMVKNGDSVQVISKVD